MAYNPAIDAVALRAEVIDNQAHYGDPGSTQVVLDKLNNPVEARQVQNSTARAFSGDDLLASIVAQPVEYNDVVDGFTNPNQVPARKAFVERMINHGAEPIPVRFHSSILAVFNQVNAPTIRAAMIAEATGPMSQVEVLFGDDSVVTKRDWVDARGNVNPDGTWS